MKEENADMWNVLRVRPEAIKNEVDKNKELLDCLQTHFYVSKPFMLDTELHVEDVGNVGTLTKLPKPELKNILTGLVRKTDTDYVDFYDHTAKTYTMERIPTSINVMDIRYFLPMVGGDIDGYYKVEKVYFGSKDSKLCLKLNLSSFIPLGKMKIPIYRIKMQPGELISKDIMVGLYEQKI